MSKPAIQIGLPLLEILISLLFRDGRSSFGEGLFGGRAIKVIKEEFILFKGVNIEEIFGREEDFLLRIKGDHLYTSSFVKVEVLG
jgi:hypothetical protein